MRPESPPDVPGQHPHPWRHVIHRTPSLWDSRSDCGPEPSRPRADSLPIRHPLPNIRERVKDSAAARRLVCSKCNISSVSAWQQVGEGRIEMVDSSAGGTQAGVLRVATLNLLSPDHADWDRRREILRSGLQDMRPDVIALQETVWVSGYDQAADLLGDDYRTVRHSARSADGVGAALASRWSFGAVGEIDLHLNDRV